MPPILVPSPPRPAKAPTVGDRSIAVVLLVVMLACCAPATGLAAFKYPPGQPNRTCPDTLKIFDIQQSDTLIAPCHPATLDTVLGIGGIITAFDTRPTAYAFYLQNVFADGPRPWTGVNIFTGATNYNGNPFSLVLGDSVFVYGRTVEFQGESEIEGPDGMLVTDDIIVRKFSSGNPLPVAKVGTTAEFNWFASVSAATSEPWEGALVRINGPLQVARTQIGAGVLANNFLLVNPNTPTDSVLVDGFTLTTVGTPPVGTIINFVQGILNQRNQVGVDSYRIQPREAGDISIEAPPNLIDAYPIEDTRLRLIFDKNLDLSTAQTEANYSLGSLGSVDLATLVGGTGTTVELDITNGLAESITVSGISTAACPSCVIGTPQQASFFNGVMTVAAIQAPDPAALGGGCEDRSRFAGAGAAAGARVTVRGVAVHTYGSLYYIADVAGGPRSGVPVFASPVQLTSGRRYRITARVQEFFGETELTSAAGIVDEGAATVPAAISQTVSTLQNVTCDAAQNQTTGEDYEGVLMRVVNARVVNFNTAPFDPVAEGSFRVVGPLDTILVSNLFGQYTFDADADMVVDVTGILHFSFGAYSLLPRADTDIHMLTAIEPDHGGNQAPISVSITGHGFGGAITPRLMKSGEADIVGTNTLVAPDTRSMATTFDLAGKAGGTWDLMVTYQDTHSDTLPGAFTIEAGDAPDLRINIVGPSLVMGQPVIRKNRRTAFDLVITNAGNVDATYVPVWVAGIPTYVNAMELGFTLGYPSQGGGEPDWTTVPNFFESAAGRYLTFVIPRVPPGTTTRRIYLDVPETNPTFQLIAALTPPWVDGAVFRSCLSGGGITNPSCMGAQLTAINAYLDANPQIEALSGIAVWAKVAWQCQGASSLANALTKSEQVLDYLGAAVEQNSAVTGCGNVLLPRWREVQTVGIVGSVDPNDKVGAQGTMTGQLPLPYMIRFENLSNATAPAQTVWVEDQLDHTKLDLTTVSLEAIRFGDVVISPPTGQANWSQIVDLRPAKNLKVEVTVSLDPFTHVLTWYFNSTVATTGLPPAPNEGFLPPNVTPPEGDGSVMFTVRPLPGLPSGTSISNAAAITFDDPPALNTPAWSNLLDNQAPASRVKAFAGAQDPGRLNVQWEPVGSWPDLRDYTIYAREDNGPYWAWRLNTVAVADTFAARAGHSYSFYSRARDLTGNIEAAPTGPDVQITSTVGVGDEPAPALALAGARPNPAIRDLNVWFALPSEAPATLELIDLAGRRVAKREVGSLGPGHHMITLGSSPRLRPGLYFVRLRCGETKLVARVALIR